MAFTQGDGAEGQKITRDQKPPATRQVNGPSRRSARPATGVVGQGFAVSTGDAAASLTPNLGPCARPSFRSARKASRRAAPANRGARRRFETHQGEPCSGSARAGLRRGAVVVGRGRRRGSSYSHCLTADRLVMPCICGRWWLERGTCPWHYFVSERVTYMWRR